MSDLSSVTSLPHVSQIGNRAGDDVPSRRNQTGTLSSDDTASRCSSVKAFLPSSQRPTLLPGATLKILAS